MSAKDTIRTISRVIASAVVISGDELILLGKKDPAAGGVYPDAWHIPGGGIDSGESLEAAVRREVAEETGLDTSHARIRQLPCVGHGSSKKTLKSGEVVICNMEFNRFEIHYSEPADTFSKHLKPGDDLVELRWFSRDELTKITHVPGGKEFFAQAGYL